MFGMTVHIASQWYYYYFTFAEREVRLGGFVMPA